MHVTQYLTMSSKYHACRQAGDHISIVLQTYMSVGHGACMLVAWSYSVHGYNLVLAMV